MVLPSTRVKTVETQGEHNKFDAKIVKESRGNQRAAICSITGDYRFSGSFLHAGFFSCINHTCITLLILQYQCPHNVLIKPENVCNQIA